MAQNFLPCDRDQALLLPPSLRAWLPEDHLAWFLLAAVEQMDLSRFYAAYRDDGHGRAAHEPAMMVVDRPRFRGHGRSFAADRSRAAATGHGGWPIDALSASLAACADASAGPRRAHATPERVVSPRRAKASR